ncbi:acyltransferase [Paenibacillus sp. 1011MAR3C5]|uniref:acyltransferase n=1 Tax=Paenibacillus sp. 1011MAR3C5 TaxID=1675787 RepID=UPI0015FFC317|nr:acyltransferase [Paenibacillus sp. 1011MAR3C5]
MMKPRGANRRYGGIDLVKLAASFLVIAIHTGPLLTYDEYADFLITGIVGRLAVPFFFMASGYLLFRKLTGKGREDRSMINRYALKVALLYLAAMMIYLPLNVYKGDFDQGISWPALARDIVIDGTFYHLWYLPALLIGIYMVYGLYRLLPRWAFAVLVCLLYAIGVMGDSYYGLAVQEPHLKAMYDWLFAGFDYTRNGFFFAPVFLAMGLCMAKHSATPKVRYVYPVALLISIGVLFLEGILLRDAGFPRHDSMYIALLPAVYALFGMAMQIKISSSARAGAIAQWIYLLHPAVLVAIRGIAGAAGMKPILVDHSLVHYIAVCVFTTIVSILAARLLDALGRMPLPPVKRS